MPIKANVEGVGTLVFPDDTPQEVIQSKVKEYISKSQSSVQPTAQSSPEQGLQQAVQESKPGFLEKLGAAISSGVSAQQFKQPQAVPESYTKLDKEELAAGARYGIPIAAGLATGGSGYLPTALAMSSGLGIGEAAAQKIESGKITSPGAVAGAAASGLVPFGKESTSLLGALAKSGTSQFAAGTVNRATKSLVDTGTVNLSDLASGGAIDFGFGSGLRLGSAVLGGAYRSMANGNRSLAGVVGEIQAPFEAEKIRRIASKLSQFAESGAASDIIGEAAGKIAQASKQDPKAVAEILTSAIKKGQSVDDKQLAQNIIGELQNSGAQLNDNAAAAVRQFAGVYEAMASQDLTTAAEGIGQVAKAGIQQAETKANKAVSELSEGYSGATKQDLADAANTVKNAANKELDAFKAESRSRYSEVESNPLFNDKFIGRRVEEGPMGGVFEGKSINDLRKELTNAYAAIDYTKPVQGATYDRYAEVKRIQNELQKALDSLPAGSPAVQKFKDAQAFYNENMTRFKGRYANSILRDIGEEGGAEATIITRLGGPDGPKYLSELKDLLGESYPEVKQALGEQIYSDLASNGPEKFVENLDRASSGGWKGIQPKVLSEFFPGFSKDKAKSAFASLEAAKKHPLKDLLDSGEPTVQFVSKLSGNKGPQYLSEIKQILGNDFEKLRDTFGQQIYTKLSSGGPRKFVENLESALSNGVEGIQPQVVKEFLPLVTPEKVAAARQALEIADNEFSQNFNKAIKEGGDLSSADPESLVSWFNKGGNSSRASKAREYLSGNPKLLDDAQNSLLTQIIADAQVKGAVTGEQIRKAAGEYNNAVTGLMGERGKIKIDDIAKAVDEAAKDASQTSLLSKLMTLTAGAVAGQRTLRATGSVPFTASATLGAAYAASKTIDYANAKIAATLLSNPSYRKAITKPYEELTNRETKMLEEEFPGVIGRIINP